MLRKRMAVVVLGGVMLAASNAALAQSVDFFFTLQGSSTQISSLTLAKGQTTFNLSVWYVVTGADYLNNGVDAMVGYDTSNSYGLSATPLDNVFTLNGTKSHAITNINAGGSTSAYEAALPVELTGGQTLNGAASNSIRPYGADVTVADFDTAYDPGVGTPVRLFDISLLNEGLAAGHSYDVVLWDGGNGVDSTCYLNGADGSILRQGGSTTLVVSAAAVPEPASLIALGLGAVALIRRRRSR